MTRDKLVKRLVKDFIDSFDFGMFFIHGFNTEGVDEVEDIIIYVSIWDSFREDNKNYPDYDVRIGIYNFGMSAGVSVYGEPQKSLKVKLLLESNLDELRQAIKEAYWGDMEKVKNFQFSV